MRSKREALALILGLLLVACSSGTVSTTGDGGTATTSGSGGTQATSPPAESADITIILAGEPTTLDPQISSDPTRGLARWSAHACGRRRTSCPALARAQAGVGIRG